MPILNGIRGKILSLKLSKMYGEKITQNQIETYQKARNDAMLTFNSDFRVGHCYNPDSCNDKKHAIHQNGDDINSFIETCRNFCLKNGRKPLF